MGKELKSRKNAIYEGGILHIARNQTPHGTPDMSPHAEGISAISGLRKSTEAVAQIKTACLCT